MWLILRYVILDLQDRVLPNLELSHKKIEYTLKYIKPDSKRIGFFYYMALWRNG